MTYPDDDRNDDVGRLIRLAGRRPVPPSERAARVKEAVRGEWLAAVRRRRRHRIAWGVAALAAAGAAIFVGTLALRLPGDAGLLAGPALIVESATGLVRADGAPLAPDHRVSFGTVVTTADAGGASFRLPAGGVARLDAGSALRAVDADRLVLERGAVYLDSGGYGVAGRVIVETPLGSVREIGTQFEARLTASGLRVRVREGKVSLDAGDRGVHEVSAASELTLAPIGSPTLREIPIHGPEWDWVARVTTVPAMEGKSARAFLEHVARERGWGLRFADPDAERAAGRIRLAGSLERLGLDDALDAVLPTCGMTYAVEGGVLIVSLAEVAS